MITARTLVRLTGNPADLCPHTWLSGGRRAKPCPVNGSHECVGDAQHRGKHVCRCGASRWVTPPKPPEETHIHATVRLPDGSVIATCTCSPDFARTVSLGSVDFETSV